MPTSLISYLLQVHESNATFDYFRKITRKKTNWGTRSFAGYIYTVNGLTELLNKKTPDYDYLISPITRGHLSSDRPHYVFMTSFRCDTRCMKWCLPQKSRKSHNKRERENNKKKLLQLHCLLIAYTNERVLIREMEQDFISGSRIMINWCPGANRLKKLNFKAVLKSNCQIWEIF